MTPPSPRDLRLVLPLLAAGLGGTRAAFHLQPGQARPPDHWAYLLVLVAVLALLLRRPAVTGALALNTGAVAAYLAAGYPFGPVLLTVPVAAFLVAAGRPRRRAGLHVLAAVAVLGVAAAVRGGLTWTGPGWWPVAALAGLWLPAVAALFAVGAATRVRRESAAGIRAEQARRAVSEEQLRMAQELHDVVGHGLAVIAMQAGVALHVLDREPERVRESLQAIRALSRESLDGLRVELDRLRDAAGDRPARRPAPGLAELDELAGRIRAGGVDVRVELRLPDRPVPAEVGSAAYRIVQESLTNVLRHTDAAQARVRVCGDEQALTVQVLDTGSLAAPDGADPSSGNGIRGMRERAEALGGRLRVGPAPAGGFEVRASLPLEPE